ncbi:MAG: hypothetical protein PW734_01130 [Verrucomicrobium sp.]|nr:hypothetical protein [Verrucomicrobium sp.]
MDKWAGSYLRFAQDFTCRLEKGHANPEEHAHKIAKVFQMQAQARVHAHYGDFDIVQDRLPLEAFVQALQERRPAPFLVAGFEKAYQAEAARREAKRQERLAPLAEFARTLGNRSHPHPIGMEGPLCNTGSFYGKNFKKTDLDAVK